MTNQELEKQEKTIQPKHRLLAFVAVLLIFTSAIVAAIVLVQKDINITKMLFSRDILGTSDQDEADESEIEKPSVFEDQLKPLKIEPKTLKVPNLNINANVIEVGVEPDGTMETPQNWIQAGWYRNSGFPGESKNVIINGHYDDSSGSPAAFFSLKGINDGDVVEVSDEYGRIFSYEVVEFTYVDVTDPNRLDVLDDEPGKSTLTLITCGGVYLPGSGYNKRLIVRAQLQEEIS